MDEINPVEILEAYLRGNLSLEEVCARLKIHRSTVWRKCRRFKSEGVRGLSHKLKGRRSNRALSHQLRETVMDLWNKQTRRTSIYAFHRRLLRSEFKVSYSTLIRWLAKEETGEEPQENPKDPPLKLLSAPAYAS